MSEETVYYWLNIDGIEDVTNEHILKLMPTAETSYNYIRNYIKELTKDLVHKRPNDEALTITAMNVLNAHVDVFDFCHQNKSDFYEIVGLFCSALLHKSKRIVDFAYSSLNDAMRTRAYTWTLRSMIAFLAAYGARQKSEDLYPTYMECDAGLALKFEQFEDSVDGLKEYSNRLTQMNRPPYNYFYCTLLDVLLTSKNIDVFMQVFMDVRAHLCASRSQSCNEDKEAGFYFCCVSLLNEDEAIRACAASFLSGRVASYNESQEGSDPALVYKNLFQVFTVIRLRQLKSA